MPLNIDFQQILLHLFNFVILFGILYFLLYKPVKKFMDKRMEHYKTLEEEAQEKLAQSEQARAEYQGKLEAAEQEISAQRQKARREQEEAGQQQLKRAEAEAERLLAEARRSIEHERAKMLRQAQDEISDMVTSAAEKVVLGRTTSQAYDQFLDAAQRSEADG